MPDSWVRDWDPSNRRPMEIQGRNIDRVLAQFFRNQVNRHGQRIPVERAMLAAGVHLSPVAVHDFHRLLDIQASCREIGAIALIAGSAEV